MPTGPLAVTDVQREAISLSWQAPVDDGGSPILNYIVEKRDAMKNTWSKVHKVPASTTEICATGLFENTEYFFRVVAENKAGQSEALETDSATMAKSPFSELMIMTH